MTEDQQLYVQIVNIEKLIQGELIDITIIRKIVIVCSKSEHSHQEKMIFSEYGLSFLMGDIVFFQFVVESGT